MTTPKIHSPFHIIEDFVSPVVCEQMIAELGLSVPTFEVDEITPISHQTMLQDTRFDEILRERLSEHADAIEARYNGSITGLDKPLFFQHFENPKKAAVPHGCEAFKWMRKSWVKVKDVDIVGFLWLKDYNSGVPLDSRFEVYGGKLEFPGYNFSILPKRGTAVIFPADAHFITAISHVLVGSSEYVKFSMKLMVNVEDGQTAWFYQPYNFPGTYIDWFDPKHQ